MKREKDSNIFSEPLIGNIPESNPYMVFAMTYLIQRNCRDIFFTIYYDSEKLVGGTVY